MAIAYVVITGFAFAHFRPHRLGPLLLYTFGGRKCLKYFWGLPSAAGRGEWMNTFHYEYRRCGARPANVKPIYVFRYGFGIWLCHRIFSCGWDQRSCNFEVSP